MVFGIKSGIKRALERLRYPDLGATLRDLKRLGFSPVKVVDVGAYKGEWTTQIRKIFPTAEILMIEAQHEKLPELTRVAKLAGGCVAIELALLGPVDGKSVSFSTMETGSSVFDERSDFPRQRIERTTRALGSVIEERYPSWDSIDLLKLDVQGYELEVLKGAEVWLPRTEMVLMEASLIPINEGCPLIGEVITFMTARGFQLLDICSQIRRTDGSLWQTDLLFVNEKSRFVPRAELTRDNWR